MPAKKTGGPAFPTAQYYDEKPIGITDGMTLRDFFAARALPAAVLTADKAKTGALFAARCAYEYADAMIKVREEQ
jgi:hypothetical protein